jgi:CelD/BcsL family acetyltransferase involved in cellulose biosynthesis
VYPTASDEQQVVLDAFFSFKASQLEVMGAPNPFKNECIRSFFRKALITQRGDSLSPRFCGLYLNGTIVATLIGVVNGTRFTTLFSAINIDKNVKASPGQQLLETLISDLCQEGIKTFDIGPGSSTQKDRWDMPPRPLFHSFTALTPIAWPSTQINIARTKITQAIKNNKRAYDFLSNVRAKITGK